MPRKEKTLFLMLLVALSVTVSLACGGGGGGDTGTTPTSSASVSPSPSPTPSPSYSLGDFEGSWHYSADAGKVDMEAGYEFWVNLDAEGNVAPEPEELGLPLVTGGSITLDDADTGAFHGTIVFKTGETTTETITFQGTMNAAHDMWTVHINEWDRDAEIGRVTGRADVAGNYSCEVFRKAYAEDTNLMFDGVAVVELRADGTFVNYDEPEADPGEWDLFREELYYLVQTYVEDGTDESTLNAWLRQTPEGFFYAGGYTMTSPDGTESGTLLGKKLAPGYFSFEDFCGTWNLMIMDDEDGADAFEQVPGFLVNTDGTVPAQPELDVTGGGIETWDPDTGYFEMRVNIHDEEEGDTYAILKGFLSPVDHRCASVVEYSPVEHTTKTDMQAGDELEETGDILMFSASSFPLPEGLDGFWSGGTLPALGSDSADVINFVLSDGLIYLSTEDGAEPVGNVISSGPGQLSFYFALEDEEDDGVTVRIYGALSPAFDHTIQATGVVYTNEGEFVTRSFMGRYDPGAAADGNKAHYALTYQLSGGGTAIVSIDSEGALTAEIGGVLYDVVWDDEDLLFFHMTSDTAGDYAEGARFVFVPHSLAVLMGQSAFTDDEGTWGLYDWGD